MTLRGRALKLTAVSTLVVLSLTGFSTGRGHGHGSGDGGGCSSSSQDHDISSSTTVDKGSGYHPGGYGTSGYNNGSHYDDDDDDYGSGSSGGDTADTADTAERPQTATVQLVSCASEDTPYATVEITNRNDREYTFTVAVDFRSADDQTIESATSDITLPANGVQRVQLPFDEDAVLSDEALDHCEVQEYLPEPRN